MTAFAALLTDGTIGGAWGDVSNGGLLPHRMLCARGVAALAASTIAFAALHSNGTIAGSWGWVAGEPQGLTGIGVVLPSYSDFYALSSAGRLVAGWGHTGPFRPPAEVLALDGVGALVAAAGHSVWIVMSDGSVAGQWSVDRAAGQQWKPAPAALSSAVLAVGTRGNFIVASAEGDAVWVPAGGLLSAAAPPELLRGLSAAPVSELRAAFWSGAAVAIRESGAVAGAWALNRRIVLDALPSDRAERFRLTGETCAPPRAIPGASFGGCFCAPPGWRCTLRRLPTWRPLRQEEWDDGAASRVAVLCPENNTHPFAPMVRLSGQVFAGVSVEPYNCSGGPQAGVDDRVLNYADCNDLHSGEYCAPRCAEGWAAVNATATGGASFLLECMPYPTTDGGFRYVNGYDASGVRCVRLLNGSRISLISRAEFDAIGRPLRPALSFETVSSSGAVLPFPPVTDCFLCDCPQRETADPSPKLSDSGNGTIGGVCGDCTLLHNVTAEYDGNARGSCPLCADGVPLGSNYPELVAVVAFRRPLLERDAPAFGHLPDLVSAVAPRKVCLPNQVLILAEGESNCLGCPVPLVCDGSNATGIRKGWWRPDKHTLNVSKCVTPHCSAAAVNSSEPACAPGSGGPLCGTCARSHRLAAKACRACGSTWAAALTTVVGAVCGVALTVGYLFVNAAVWLEDTAFRDIIQLTLSHLQFLSLLPYFLGPIYGAVMNALLGGLKGLMAPLAAAAPLLCLLPPHVGQVEVAWAAVGLLWTLPPLAGLLAAAALPPLLRCRLGWRLRRAAAGGKGRIAGAECTRCGRYGGTSGCACAVLAVCPCGAEWATRSCASCAGGWVCDGCAARCTAVHPASVADCTLRRTGPMQLPRRTLFWMGVNLATNFLLPHCVSVVASGFQLASYDERTRGGWLRRRVVLVADARVRHSAGEGLFATFALLIAAAVLPMVAVYWRLWRAARGEGLGSAHAVLAYGVFYAPYRLQFYLWGLFPFALKVAAAAAATLIESSLNKAAFGVALHASQLVVVCLLRPEVDLTLTWVTGGTVLVTIAGGQWLLMEGGVHAVAVRTLISFVNLWCFWRLFRALHAVAPPVAVCRRRCAANTVAGLAAAAGAAKAAGSAPRPASPRELPTQGAGPPPRLRALLRALHHPGAVRAGAELLRSAARLPAFRAEAGEAPGHRAARRRRRALRAAEAMLQLGGMPARALTARQQQAAGLPGSSLLQPGRIPARALSAQLQAAGPLGSSQLQSRQTPPRVRMWRRPQQQQQQRGSGCAARAGVASAAALAARCSTGAANSRDCYYDDSESARLPRAPRQLSAEAGLSQVQPPG
eukprot:TRINITY_DN23017_c0_g1_i12.p1 TRINITY_DN23017_c0_g1~~TRINITY_DN23017_c0_g1_i12.p1  ORF type:complete len:1450 (+),score=290.82 TRINITY_DN23017_c0_g1_i12:371-4351(+)